MNRITPDILPPGRKDCPLCGGRQTLEISYRDDDGEIFIHCFDAGCVGTFNDFLKHFSSTTTPTSKTKPKRQSKPKPTPEQVLQDARQRLSASVPADPSKGYFARKGVQPHGVPVDRSGTALVVVVNIYGELKGLQRLFAEKNTEGKDKFFTKGTDKKGCFHLLDDQPIDPNGIIYICEGFATAASVQEASGKPTICAFDAGNLKPVAKALRGRHPRAELIICGDDDTTKERNAGRTKAIEAALAVDGKACFPTFKSDDGKPTDFNDLHCREGLEIVRAQIEAAVVPVVELGEPVKEEAPPPEWPTLGLDALKGFTGDFVGLATRNSEADPAAVLLTFLVRFGVEAGRKKTMAVGDTTHKPILSCVIVGSSSKARKGTSAKPVDKLFLFPETLFGALKRTTARTSKGPFSSGEGIIYAIRDAVKKYNVKDQREEIIDPGVDDKRLFVLDEEFGGVLANTKREGNTLSMIIRQMWDGGTLDPLTKNNKIRATEGVVGWVSHITVTELDSRLAESESFNGFANRILWGLARRQKLVPIPEPMPRHELEDLQIRLLDILKEIEGEGSVELGHEARGAWCDHYYSDLTKDRPGLAGCTTNRGEAQVLRLAMIYCLLDGERTISLEHLKSGVAVWEYCRQSANYIFAGRTEDATSQRIIDALQQGSMSSTELYKAFGNHLNKAKLGPALKELLASNRITAERRKTKGAPSTVYHISKPLGELSEFDRLSPLIDSQPDLNISNSLNSLRDNKNPEDTNAQLVSNGEFWEVD